MDNKNCGKKIKVLYIFTSCKKTGPTQQLLNLISNLDRDRFDPYLVTVYDEGEESLLEQYKKVVPHRKVKLSQKEMLIGHVSKIKDIIQQIQPDIVHTSGVLPDFMIARLGIHNHVLTSRNYVYDDYPAEFGKVKGVILAKVHLYAITHTPYAMCCSKSLHDIYLKKEKIEIQYIRNGVDIQKYYPANDSKLELRRELKLPLDKKIIVYGALFNDRKNQGFILQNFANRKEFENCCLLLLGDGPNYSLLKEQYLEFSNILMPGNVSNMPDYLRASDYYVSSSKSEGLPNGVLEAMATGLPVLLSDIEQHLEVLEPDSEVGLSYTAGDDDDFVNKMCLLLKNEYSYMSNHAIDSVNTYFSAPIMSKNYQALYNNILLK